MRPRLVLLAAALLWASAARGQSRDPAAAEVLFSAGRDALAKGDYETACSKLQESQRLDPAAGTLLNLGACNQKRGRLASAWENWRGALELMTRDDERRPQLEQRIAELEARLPRLEVKLAPSAPPDSVVTRDGIVLGGPSLGLSSPVDAGVHRIEVAAPGRATRAYEVTVEEAKSETLEVEPGEALPAAAKPETAPVAQPGSKAPTPAPAQSGNGRRTLGFVIGGVGLASLAVGGVTGILALNRKNTIEEDCDKVGDRYLCGDAGVDAASSGSTLATISTITVLAGAGALVAGSALILTSSDGTSQTALSAGAGPRTAWLALSRTF